MPPMKPLARFALALLGLLVLFGVVHAPLHADADHYGEVCHQLALCSGAVVLLCAAAPSLLLFRRQALRVRAQVRGPQATAARIVVGNRGPPRG